MKKILPYIGVVLLGTFIAIGAEIFFPQEESRVWHHEIGGRQYCETIKEGEFCSHLPLVKINTNGRKLDFTAERLADIEITDRQNGHNHLNEKADLKTKALIKIRGNSSAYFDKKQYRLTFVDADTHKEGGQNLQEMEQVSYEVMGMPAESEWVLNGPFLDKTLLRNYLMYNLSGEVMDWAPNVRYCEVFFNRQYKGVYLMIEAVKADKNRVDLAMINSKNPKTDYMVAREREGDTNYPLNNFGSYAAKDPGELGVVYPGARSGRTEAQLEFVRRDISRFEKMLYSPDYDDPEIGYKSAIDVQSFVDYFILNEFSLNVDGGQLSTYMYRDMRSGFKMGPVWDFNNGFDNYEDNAVPKEEFCLIFKPWYSMLIRDEEFVEQVIQRYKFLRTEILSEERIERIIDETIAFLGPAIERNDDVWGYSYKDGRLQNVDMDSEPLNYERNPKNYAHALRQLKECIHKRGTFLDKNIHVLRQFCAESKVKEWN